MTHHCHSWSLSCISEWKKLLSRSCIICGIYLLRICNNRCKYFMFLCFCCIILLLFFFLWIYIPKIWYKFYIFVKVFLIFSLIFLFKQLPEIVVFSSPEHDIKRPCPWPSSLMTQWRFAGKKLIYVMIPANEWKIDLEPGPSLKKIPHLWLSHTKTTFYCYGMRF